MASPKTVKNILIDPVSSGTRAKARDYIFETTFQCGTIFVPNAGPHLFPMRDHVCSQCGTMFVPNAVAGFSPRSILRLPAYQFLQQSDSAGFSNRRLTSQENPFREGHGCTSLFVFQVKLAPFAASSLIISSKPRFAAPCIAVNP